MTPSKKSKRSRWEVVEYPDVTDGLSRRVRGKYTGGRYIGLRRYLPSDAIRFRVVLDEFDALVLIAERKVTK